MCKPVGDVVLVEVIKENSVLITVNNQYGIVKVLAKSETCPSSEGLNRDVWSSLDAGKTLLVNAVKDYVIGDKKYYFTTLSDIVCII